MQDIETGFAQAAAEIDAPPPLVYTILRSCRQRIFTITGSDGLAMPGQMRNLIEAGEYTVQWDASHMASSIYFYRFEATNNSDPSTTFTQVKKMVLMK